MSCPVASVCKPDTVTYLRSRLLWPATAFVNAAPDAAAVIVLCWLEVGLAAAVVELHAVDALLLLLLLCTCTPLCWQKAGSEVLNTRA
jgi:hypothetical protein